MRGYGYLARQSDFPEVYPTCKNYFKLTAWNDGDSVTVRDFWEESPEEAAADALMYVEEAIEKLSAPCNAQGMAYLTEETLKQKVILIDELTALRKENADYRTAFDAIYPFIINERWSEGVTAALAALEKHR